MHDYLRVEPDVTVGQLLRHTKQGSCPSESLVRLAEVVWVKLLPLVPCWQKDLGPVIAIDCL